MRGLTRIDTGKALAWSTIGPTLLAPVIAAWIVRFDPPASRRAKGLRSMTLVDVAKKKPAPIGLGGNTWRHG